MMFRLGWIGLIGAMAAHVPAQTVALSGKVTDGSGKAIGGALVSLKSNRISDTTDASGAYALSGTATALHGSRVFPGQGTMTLQRGILHVDLEQSNRVRVDLFDLQGNLLTKAVDKAMPRGNYHLDLKPSELGAKVTLVRVTVGEQQAQFLAAPQTHEAGGGIAAPVATHSGNALAKAQAVDDALEASALGYKTKAVPITSYEAVVNITLESDFTGTCTQSKAVNSTAKGNGPHSVVVETNADAGIKEGTIFRPADLGPGKNYPIILWGEGACALNGLDNSAAMAQLASHGYFVIADGTPNGTGSRNMNANNLEEMGRPMLAYMSWIVAENRKPCSAYYQSLDTSKIGANGFSCGGLLSMGTAKDPRTTTWGLTSSGSFSNNPTLWNSVHTPVLIIEGHQDNTGAYDNGLRDYNGIAPLGHPILFMSHKNQGHGGDLWSANGGDFTKIHLAWMNWWLKGDVGATGKGALVGSGCTFCSNSNWEVKSANLP